MCELFRRNSTCGKQKTINLYVLSHSAFVLLLIRRVEYEYTYDFFFFWINDDIFVVRNILQMPKVLDQNFLEEEEMNNYQPENERKKKE
jgi:hypothetical protein